MQPLNVSRANTANLTGVIETRRRKIQAWTDAAVARWRLPADPGPRFREAAAADLLLVILSTLIASGILENTVSSFGVGFTPPSGGALDGRESSQKEMSILSSR